MLNAKRTIVQLVSVAILSLGFAQFSVAGVVGSDVLINAEMRGERISNIEAFVARADVADQLLSLGVSPEIVSKRVQNMTDQELLQLEQSINEQVAGGDALAIIGTVFLVLLILELVGVTDIFKAI